MILKTKSGLFSKGYGKIYQIVMKDKRLSITAKAIYLYICTYVNKEGIAYPSTSTIQKDLKISKNTYFKHFKSLTECGYINIDKCKKAKMGLLNHNIYRLNYEYILKMNGNKDIGYGFISKNIMQDERLSCKAKALLGYFWALAQSEKVVYPKVLDVCESLNISSRLYYRLINELVNLQYIAKYKNLIGLNDFTCDCKEMVQNWYYANIKKKNDSKTDCVQKWDNSTAQNCDNSSCQNWDNNNSTKVTNTKSKNITNKDSSIIILSKAKEYTFDLIDFKKQINFSKLKYIYGELAINVVKAIEEVVSSSHSYIIVGKNKLTKSEFFERIRYLTFESIKRLMDIYKNRSRDIYNHSMYLRVCLYKLQDTMGKTQIMKAYKSHRFLADNGLLDDEICSYSSFDIEELEKIV